MAEPTKPDATKPNDSRAPKVKTNEHELPEADLNKVTGGVIKSGDPCDGGNVHRG